MSASLPSHDHPNRRWHNWLAYDINDRYLVKHAPKFSGTLYDLGCGEAPYRSFFLQHVQDYVGVDWADSQHAFCADIVADLNERLPLADMVADTVVSLSVLEHLREPQHMLCEACRILRPGGRIVLQVPWQWWIHEAPHDYFRYTPHALELLLERAGFVDIDVEATAGYFTTAILKWNYFTRRFVAGPKPVRAVLLGLFSIFWFAGQLLAPLLDRLDRNWALEAAGFFVTARKP